ncbi:MAG: hypothetical protein CL878_07720 [Dehalococcoidia bacterium]|nr:hypothetical protein [Dehalococcoidia bacterium]
MSTEEPPALVADLGTAAVRAFALEQVEGDRRMVASVNVPVPSPAVRSAVATAFAAATKQVLQFSSDADAPSTAAAHLLTNRPAVPRTLVVAPRADQVVVDTLEALSEACVHLLEPLYVSGRNAPSLGSVAEHLREVQADIVILLCSGRRQEWLPIQAVAELLAHSVIGPSLPAPVVVGDIPEALDAVTQALGPTLPPGSAPATNSDELIGNMNILQRRRTGAALHRDGIRRLPPEPGMTSLVSSSLQATARASRLLARRYELDSYVMDIGVSHGAVYAASRDESTHHVRADLGGQYGPATILREVGAQAVLRWLPTDVPIERLDELATLRMTYPNCPATTLEELLIEHAFLREQVHLLSTGAQRHIGDGPGSADRPMDLLVVGGSVLAQTPRVMQALLILLDALQPEGLTNLAVDRTGGLPILGLLSSPVEGPVASMLESDAVLNAGLVVAPVGRGREGQTAISVEVAYADRSPVTTEVPYGSLSVVLLPPGEQAALKLWPERDFDIGLGPGNAATPRFEIEGGAAGIIVDARGRPLELPEGVDRRQARMLDWFQSSGAYPPLPFVAAREAEAAADATIWTSSETLAAE